MRSVELLRRLPSGQSVIESVIERNTYRAHPEAVLLAMMADEDADVCCRAVCVIQQCRQNPQHGVRPFVFPSINFAADNYTALMNWETELFTDPPLTMGLSDQELHSIRDAPLALNAYPMHTTGVKRTVKGVKESAGAVVGGKERLGWICNRLRHREQPPVIQSQQSFVKSLA